MIFLDFKFFKILKIFTKILNFLSKFERTKARLWLFGDLCAGDQSRGMVTVTFFDAMLCLGVGRPLSEEIPCDVRHFEASLKCDTEECACESERCAVQECDAIGPTPPHLPVLPIPPVFMDVPEFTEEWEKHKVSRQSHTYSPATIARLMKEFSKGMELMFLGDSEWRAHFTCIAASVAQACDVTKTGQHVTVEQVRQWFWNQMTKRGWFDGWVETMLNVVQKAKARWEEQGDARALLFTPHFDGTEDDKLCEIDSQNMSLCQKEKNFINEISSERQGGRKINAQPRFNRHLKRKPEIRKPQRLIVKHMCAPAPFEAAVFDVTLGPLQKHRSNQMALQLDQWFAQDPK